MKHMQYFVGMSALIGLSACRSPSDARPPSSTTPEHRPAPVAEAPPSVTRHLEKTTPGDTAPQGSDADERESTAGVGATASQIAPATAETPEKTPPTSPPKPPRSTPAPAASASSDGQEDTLTREEAIRALIPIAEEHLPSTVPDLKSGKVHLKQSPADKAPDNTWSIDLAHKRFRITSKSKAGAGRKVVVLTILGGGFFKKSNTWIAVLRTRMMS